MTELQEFIKKRPHLIWYVKDYAALDERSIVEHVLNYGTWEDFKEMIRIIGIGRGAQVFRESAFRPRTNYYPEVRRYFDLYFNAHTHTS